jgi:hypothetical protein
VHQQKYLRRRTAANDAVVLSEGRNKKARARKRRAFEVEG